MLLRSKCCVTRELRNEEGRPKNNDYQSGEARKWLKMLDMVAPDERPLPATLSLQLALQFVHFGIVVVHNVSVMSARHSESKQGYGWHSVLWMAVRRQLV